MANSDKTFGVVDYLIFVGTILISVFIGVYYAFIKKQQTNDELLVGGRKMAVLPISLSLLATYMSAILVLGFTGEVYANGMIIAVMAFGALFFIPLSGFLFLPTLYNLRLTSAYEYLERRFDSKVVRYIATATFIAQIVLYMGVVIFAPALALNVVGDFPIWISILIIGGSAGVYTAIGGIKAVVWTDVFQALMMFCGMLAIIIQGSIKIGGFGEAWRIANDHDRLNFFDFTIDPFQRHTTLGIFFGLGTFWLNGYGCHQTTVQRYCSMPSLKKAFAALFMTAPLVLFTMSLALLSGVVIFANYADCDPLALGFIKRSDQIAPHFVLEVLADIPGLLGLFNACLLSGALSTVSSGLNSLAAVTWEDFCKNLSIFRDMTETKKSWVVKGLGFFYAALTIAMGFIASTLGGVLSVALIVNGAVTGPLLGVFVLGIFLPFVNKYGAAIGMLVAHVITLWISFGSLALARRVPSLPLRIDGCSEEITGSVNMTAALLRQTKLMTPPEPLEWPEKIYTLSYTIQPLVGLGLTVIVGIIVSLFTGLKKFTKDDEKYTHYLVVKLYRRMQKLTGASTFEMENKPASDKSSKVTLNRVYTSDGRRHSGNTNGGSNGGGGIKLQVNANGYKLSRHENGAGSPDGAYDNPGYQ